MTGIAAPPRLEIQRAAMLFGRLRQPQDVFGDQRLLAVTTDYAGLQRSFNRRQRGLGRSRPSIRRSSRCRIAPARSSAFPGPRDAAKSRLRFIRLRARGDGDDADARPQRADNIRLCASSRADHLGADSAEPRNTTFQGCDHNAKTCAGMSLSPVGERNHVVQRFDPLSRKRRTPRAAWRCVARFPPWRCGHSLANAAERDARRDHDAGFLHQSRSRTACCRPRGGFRQRRPGEHRGGGRRNLPSPRVRTIPPARRGAAVGVAHLADAVLRAIQRGGRRHLHRGEGAVIQIGFHPRQRPMMRSLPTSKGPCASRPSRTSSTSR